MEKVEKTMGLLMGVSLSLLLTLTGTLSSGSFALLSFLSGFLVSFAVSTLLTRILPVQKIASSLSKRLKLRKGTVPCRLLETLVSDLLMSPVMTLIMVWLAWRQATAHGARIPFGPMLLKSEILSFLVAFAAIFLLTPLFLKFALQRAGADPRAPRE